MYARAKAAGGGDWVAHLRNFFQYLTQAVTKIDRAAIVASLLATDPARQNDPLGKQILRDFADIFRRQREEGVQPVQKKDVAEVLRRRFFEPESIRDLQAHKPHVIGIVKGIAKLDETTRTAKTRSRGAIPSQLPLPPRPHRRAIQPLDTDRRLPAHAGHPADPRDGSQRRGTVGPEPAGRPGRPARQAQSDGSVRGDQGTCGDRDDGQR